MSNTRKAIVVAGGAGAMGRITVRDLVETAADDIDIVVADYDLSAAKKLCKSFKREVRPLRIDITNPRGTAKALKGSFGVIGAVQHQLNLQLMEACLGAGAHYCDLGGLFHYTRKQLKLDKKFRKAERLAVLGVGAAPGVVNVMAAAVAADLDEVREIHVKVGNVDRTQGRGSSPLGTSYSLSTILDEANMPAPLFTGGAFTTVEPMSGAEDVDFGAPVGMRRPAFTIHSEVATLPLSFASKGVQEVSFRIAFSNELDERLRFLRALGASSDKPVLVGKKKHKVVPRELLMALASKTNPPPFDGVPDEYEVLRVVVKGTSGGVVVEETIDCHCPGMPAWGLSVDVDTGCPPSILMQMLARGELPVTAGVLAPEVAIPSAPFFKELEKRGMRIERRRTATATAT